MADSDLITRTPRNGKAKFGLTEAGLARLEELAGAGNDQRTIA